MPSIKDQTDALLRPGETCWRKVHANRVALIVDAADYFVHLREALTCAKQAIYLIGWDFDLRIEMMPGQSDEQGIAPDGWPNRLGEFLEAFVERRPEVRLHILKWDGAMMAELATQAWETLSLKLASDTIHFALDSHHPVGACHHQKIVVIDDRVAFCGGIDVTTGRWDTRDHAPDDPRRADPDGELHQAWHDVTTALEGPVAGALGDLARYRWEAATGEKLAAPEDGGTAFWPDTLEPDICNIEIGIARSAPHYHGSPLVNEIENLYLAAIQAARHTIYIESQYFASGSLCEALEARLAEPDGPEILVINPQSAQSLLEDEAMHSVRSRMITRLCEVAERGGGGRFAIFHPVNADDNPIYVHAKIFVVDDWFLKLGSSNIDNRSMGFDTECDIAIEAKNDPERALIRNFTLSLLGEHLDCTPEAVRDEWDENCSLLGAVKALRMPVGRSLHPVEPQPLDPLEQVLADSRIFDPRHHQSRSLGAKEHLEHAVKNALGPVHRQETGLVTILLAVGLTGIGVWLGHQMFRRSQRQSLASPAIIGDMSSGPSARRDLHE